MDNQETQETKRQTQKHKTEKQVGSVTGSSSVPILNPAWIYISGLTKRQGGDWKLWISGYKLDLKVGGREDQNPLNYFDAI